LRRPEIDMKNQAGWWLITLLVAVAAAALPALADQAVYKWVDEEGVVHFSETPPQDAPSGSVEKLTVQPAPPGAARQAAVPPDKPPAARRTQRQPAPASAPAEAAVPDISAMTLDELDRRCDAARERKIAPLRQAEIEKCQADKRNDPAWCERFNADFGDAGRTINGTMRPRMFDDLPEYVDALDERNRRGR